MSATKAKTQYAVLTELASGLSAELADIVDDSSIEVSSGDLQVKAGGITQAMHAEQALQAFEIPFGDFLAADGADLAITETAGDFFRNIGTNQLFIDGEASQNETETSVGWFRFTLPHNYVSAGDVKVRLVVGVEDGAAGTLGSCTIDVSAYEQGLDGTVGSDLCATAALAIDTTYAAKDFTITATNLVAGDVLVVKVTAVVIETGNSNTINARITKIQVLCDVQG